ncbi:hypothetical protein GC167_08035 [bacterium]|nr:hypothetical protein [bacterium]
MKSQDVLLALKIVANTPLSLRQMDLALSLHISLSEISRSLNRLSECKIYSKEIKTIDVLKLMEFIQHAAPFVLRIHRTGPTGGKPLFQSSRLEHNKFQIPVQWGWNNQKGKKGLHGYAPFHPSVPMSCQSDPILHRLVVLFERTLIADGLERDNALIELYALLEQCSDPIEPSESREPRIVTSHSKRNFRSSTASNEPIDAAYDAFHR